MDRDSFRVVVNGVNHEANLTTLADLVSHLGHDQTVVATAVNGVFVPRTARRSHQLNVDDNIEIVSPRQGG